MLQRPDSVLGGDLDGLGGQKSGIGGTLNKKYSIISFFVILIH